MFQQKVDNGFIKCLLCPHECIIAKGKTGKCRVRVNEEGTLYPLYYSRPAALSVDPVEKKPLYHLLPGSDTYSLSCPGCNFDCSFCQNSEIADASSYINSGYYSEKHTPGQAVQNALTKGCRSISYTYTEPTVFFEYAYDTGIAGREKGLKNIFVTNGYISLPALRKASEFLDASNIDLKSSENSFYKKYCGGKLFPVIETISEACSLGILVEVTTLIIPGVNDGDKQLRDLAGLIAGISADIPWHISAFHPAKKMMDIERTGVGSLNRACEAGLEAGINYIYTGNTAAQNNTLCPSCGKMLISRKGFRADMNKLDSGLCPSCLTKIPGIWD